jgi:hemerythrin-like metal-binding protein/PAS domain S-box-containing protein/putative nucleotidyltransferase with HDIG domain
VAWLICTTVLVSALLAVLSVSSSALTSAMPRSEVLRAIFNWWIGETVGALTVTPFLLIFVMPGLKRFVEGQTVRLPARRSFPPPTLSAIGQAASIALTLYLAFGAPALAEFHPLYLITLPIIWIALTRGFKGISVALLALNFGVVLALWLFRFDPAGLGELELLMIVNCIVGLLMGAIVSERKQAEEELVIANKELLFQNEEKEKRAAELVIANKELLFQNEEKEKRAAELSTVVEKLKRNEELLRETGTLAKVGGSEINLSDMTLNWTDEVFRIHELEPGRMPSVEEELDYYAPEARPIIQEAVNNAIATGEGWSLELPLITAKGKHLWIRSMGKPEMKDGKTSRILSVFQDITERKQSETALHDSEIRYRALIENSSDAVMLINSEGKIIYRSPAVYRLMGLDPAALLDNSMFSTIHPDDLKDALKSFAQLLQTLDKSILFQFRVQHSDGSWRWMEGTGTNLLTEPAVNAIVVNYRDITERKQAEEEIKNSNDELSMLFELSHSLAGADNLDDIFELVNRHAVESIHTTFARIALLEEDKYIMRAAYPIRPFDHDLRIGERYPVISLPYSQRILEQKEPMILRASDPGISNEEKKALLLDFAQTLCLIPLRISDSSQSSENFLGLLMLGEARNEAREPLTSEKIRLAQTIGDSAAIAIRRMLLREQTERRLQELVALNEINLAITSSSDMVISLGVLLLQVINQLRVDAVDIWLFNPTSQMLEFASSRGFRTPAFEHGEPLHLGEGNAGQAALGRRTIHVPDLTADNVHPRLKKAMAEEPFIGFFAVPLLVQGEVKGVLELFQRTELEPNEEWLDFLHALANQAAIAIDNSSLFKDLQESNIELTQAYDATIQGWSRALDLRDNETEGHTQRVTELMTRLGRLFGLSEEDLAQARWGALLHDIGKMGVPDGILLKPGPLTDEEWIVMRKHTTYGFELLSPIHFLRTAVDIPYCHHEKWDGSGYPRGLKGDAIPLPARIFALVDVYDALTSDRPYRKAWPEIKVLEHIRSLSGTHFDPQVVKICLEPGLLKGQTKRRMQMEPVQWTEKFSVGVRELDQQHQQLIKMLNRLIATQGTITTHSETISDILMAMTRYAQVHFKTEERLMEAYGYPGLEEQKMQHRDFRKNTVGFSTATTFGINQVPEDLLAYLTNWLVHHILEDDMAYRAFFIDKGVE